MLVETQISLVLGLQICPTSPSLSLLGFLSLYQHFQRNLSSRHPSYQHTFFHLASYEQRKYVLSDENPFMSLTLDPRLDLIQAHLIILPFFSHNYERNPRLLLKAEFYMWPLHCTVLWRLQNLILLNFFSWIINHPFYTMFFPFIVKHAVALV